MPDTAYVITIPDSIEWSPAPKGMPVGYQQVLIVGNPRAVEQFTFRANIRANWRAMPHFHPADEHITVLEGCCFVGIGSQYDEEAALVVPAGAFVMLKAGTHHHFFTEAERLIQVHALGPQRITSVNPSDDPRNAGSQNSVIASQAAA